MSNYPHTMCRIFGHAWASIETQVVDPEHVLWVCHCSRCDGVRTDEIELATGEVTRRRYSMSPTYATDRKLTRAGWRKEYLATETIRKVTRRRKAA